MSGAGSRAAGGGNRGQLLPLFPFCLDWRWVKCSSLGAGLRMLKSDLKVVRDQPNTQIICRLSYLPLSLVFVGFFVGILCPKQRREQ